MLLLLSVYNLCIVILTLTTCTYDLNYINQPVPPQINSVLVPNVYSLALLIYCWCLIICYFCFLFFTDLFFTDLCFPDLFFTDLCFTDLFFLDWSDRGWQKWKLAFYWQRGLELPSLLVWYHQAGQNSIPPKTGWNYRQSFQTALTLKGLYHPFHNLIVWKYTLSVQNIKNTFLILSCTAFCPQNSLNLSWTLQDVKGLHRDVSPCWLQCFPQLCQQKILLSPVSSSSSTLIEVDLTSDINKGS